MKPRIGVLTSGGDCPGLNAVLRGVVLAAEKLGWEVLGFRDGFEGLLPPGDHVVLDRKSTDGIMTLGGTIIGTTNRGHFIAKVGAGDRAIVPAEIIAEAREILNKLGIKSLIIVGGDGSMATALQLQEAGINCIGVPKTSFSAASTTPRKTALSPGQSPPLVSTPIRGFIFVTPIRAVSLDRLNARWRPIDQRVASRVRQVQRLHQIDSCYRAAPRSNDADKRLSPCLGSRLPARDWRRELNSR